MGLHGARGAEPVLLIPAPLLNFQLGRCALPITMNDIDRVAEEVFAQFDLESEGSESFDRWVAKQGFDPDLVWQIGQKCADSMGYNKGAVTLMGLSSVLSAMSMAFMVGWASGKELGRVTDE